MDAILIIIALTIFIATGVHRTVCIRNIQHRLDLLEQGVAERRKAIPLNRGL